MATTPDSSLKSQLPFELVYQVVALIVAVILVHLVYITVIRPNADAILSAQAERAEALYGPVALPARAAARGGSGRAGD